MQKLLKSPAARWKLVRAELQELASNYADPRRTRITGKLDEPEFDAEAFIVDEDGDPGVFVLGIRHQCQGLTVKFEAIQVPF